MSSKIPGAAARMIQTASLAQRAFNTLERVERELRIQTALHNRAEDRDVSEHVRWREVTTRSIGAGVTTVRLHANDDSVMWKVTRISITRLSPTAITAQPAYIALDKADTGLVETCPSALVSLTLTPAGFFAAQYADAFNNNVYVASGRVLYAVVTTEGIEDITVRYQYGVLDVLEPGITAEHDLDSSFEPDPDSRAAYREQIDVPGAFERHETPDVYAERPADQPALGPAHTDIGEEPGTQHVEQRPDFNRRLPAHLADALNVESLATDADMDESGIL